MSIKNDVMKENQELKQLLKESLNALCEYRHKNGKCTSCKTMHYCQARNLIPKIEKILNMKGKQK